MKSAAFLKTVSVRILTLITVAAALLIAPQARAQANTNPQPATVVAPGQPVPITSTDIINLIDAIHELQSAKAAHPTNDTFYTVTYSNTVPIGTNVIAAPGSPSSWANVDWEKAGTAALVVIFFVARILRNVLPLQVQQGAIGSILKKAGAEIKDEKQSIPPKTTT